MEATNVAGLYDLPMLDWAKVEARLNEGLEQAPGDGGLGTVEPGGATRWRF